MWFGNMHCGCGGTRLNIDTEGRLVSQGDIRWGMTSRKSLVEPKFCAFATVSHLQDNSHLLANIMFQGSLSLWQMHKTQAFDLRRPCHDSFPSHLHSRTRASMSDARSERKHPLLFQHRPLLTPDNIRLLRLLPGVTPLQCEFFEYALRRATVRSSPYEALSYLWGSDDTPTTLLIEHCAPNHAKPCRCALLSSQRAWCDLGRVLVCAI